MKKVILDVDTGIDDALAIAYAVHSPELHVIGLTTCYGNVTAWEATRNTLFVLEKLGKNIPVYEGALEPLVRGEREEYARKVHGENGLGNVKIDLENSEGKMNDYAIEFILQKVKEFPNEITLISVGPLTNLALAIQKEPQITQLFKEVIIMGGAIYRHGNVTPYAEANIYCDPEAADIVLQSGIPIILVGLDVTMKTLLPLSEIKKWRENEKGDHLFLADMTEFYIKFYENFQPGIGGCALHDPLAVGVAIDRSFVTTKQEKVKVILEGEETGKTIPTCSNRAPILVCNQVDEKRFLNHFLSRVGQSNE